MGSNGFPVGQPKAQQKIDLAATIDVVIGADGSIGGSRIYAGGPYPPKLLGRTLRQRHDASYYFA